MDHNYECKCPECTEFCLIEPGRLIPSDMPKIAAYLNITVPELINNYLVKQPYRRKIQGEMFYMAAPAKYKGKNLIAQPGTVIQDYYDDERGRCIFFDTETSECKIHPVKPAECLFTLVCKKTFREKRLKPKEVEEFFLIKWKGESL